MVDKLEAQQVEQIAAAIGKADAAFGYSFNLTRLVDGEETHTLSMPGFDPVEFSDRDEGYALIAERRNRMRAEAILATLPTPTEDARERVKVLEEADAEVERVMSLSDAEVMAEADPSDVAWAQGVKLGTKIGISAKADDALRWYAEQVAGCRKIGRAGDPFRQALDQDGGQRARTALGNKETDRHG